MGEEERTDPILTMFDKFQSSHLTEEGVAILKSMADSIRSALEKGMILEQMLIEQKSKIIEKSNTSKKKKKKKKSSIDGGILENPITNDKELMEGVNMAPSYINDLQPDSNKTCKLANSFQNSAFQENRPLIALNDMPTPFVESKIKLLDPSLLLKYSMKPNQAQNETILTNSYHCATCNHIRSSNSPKSNINQILNNSFQHGSDNLNQFNGFSSPLTYTSNESGLLIPKEEPVDNIGNATSVGTPPTNNLNVPTTLASPKIPTSNLPEQNVYEQPVMPCPIIIKSEHNTIQDKSPKSLIPLDLKLNVSTNVEQPENTTGNNTSPKSVSRPTPEPAENKEENPKHYSPHTSNEFKVFIEAGQDSTEEDVLKIFKDFDVTYCRVIQRPLYCYGFVSFSSEEHMMEAIKLSNQFNVGGKSLIIRQCMEQRISYSGPIARRGRKRCVQKYDDSMKRGRFSDNSDRVNKGTFSHHSPRKSNYREKRQYSKSFSGSTSVCEEASPHFRSRPANINQPRQINNSRHLNNRNWSDMKRGRPQYTAFNNPKRFSKPNLGSRQRSKTTET